jgi:hypothetical protein
VYPIFVTGDGDMFMRGLLFYNRGRTYVDEGTHQSSVCKGYRRLIEVDLPLPPYLSTVAPTSTQTQTKLYTVEVPDSRHTSQHIQYLSLGHIISMTTSHSIQYYIYTSSSWIQRTNCILTSCLLFKASPCVPSEHIKAFI